MKISYNWLKEYVSSGLTPEEIADILSNIGLEVEEVTPWQSVPGGLKDLVIGEVKSVSTHPNADKLQLTSVDIGDEEPLQIVCGAPNVAPGQKVIVAPVNATIHPTTGDPFKIKKAKIRGEYSFGMICAEDEIGLGNGHEGIMVLNGDAQTGQRAAEYFSVTSDTIFDVGLTPNRADAFSHIGVARDLHAYLQAKGEKSQLKTPDPRPAKGENGSHISVTVQNSAKCSRYMGITLKGVQVKPSPGWMQTRLKSIGIRPINNVVDITNYVLHECGQPLHAFDASMIADNQIIVKCLPDKTPFTTLDEEDRQLSNEDLMICDSNRGLCIAGVYGGVNSGVTTATECIFLESASFDAVSIRRTAVRHNLRTDAALHFEKGLDPNMADFALKRAICLLQELAGAHMVGELQDIYPDPVLPAQVDLHWQYIDALSGTEIDKSIIKNILKALQFEIVKETDEGLTLKVPTFKTEVTRPADVAEEILRLYGFNNIPLPDQFSAQLDLENHNDIYLLQAKAAEYLVAEGFCEMLNLSFSNSDLEENGVTLINGLSKELTGMRGDMLNNGLKTVAHNLNHRNEDLCLFEFGRTYHKNHVGYSEQEVLTLFMTGHTRPENWQYPTQNVGLYDLLEVVEGIFKRLNIDVSREPGSDNRFELAIIQKTDNREIGILGSLSKKLLSANDIKSPVWYASINWDRVKSMSSDKISINPIPRFPSIRRDLALTLDEGVQYGQIADLAYEQASHLLQTVNLFDIYRDDKLGKGKKSYAVSFVFQHSDRTLTDEEVENEMKKLVSLFEKKLGAIVRK